MKEKNAKMRFARLGPAGNEQPLLLTDDTACELGVLTTDIDGSFLAVDSPDAARAALADRRQ
jgi:2,4-didehydro-3-deoxy-L-rhamnonate hydrolase